MKAKRFGWQAVAAAAMMAACAAHAEEGGIQYKVSGFGTIAATTTDEGDQEFRAGLYQSQGAGSNLDLGVDTKFGVQGQVLFNPQFSVTAQLLAQRKRVDTAVDSNRDLDIGVEWLFAQYTPKPGVDLRLGRVVMPAFMISDSRSVGYAQPWLRAPLAIYAQMPMTTLDGVQLLWRQPIGAATLTVQPSYGTSAFNVSSGPVVLDGKSDKLFNINTSLEWQDWTARLGYTQSTAPLAVDLLQVGALGLPPVSFDLSDKFTSLGLQYDNGTALFMTEWARRKMKDLPLAAPAGYADVPVGGGATLADVYAARLGGRPLAKTTSWYVAGGWRFGNWLPMLAISQATNDLTKVKTKGLDLSVRYEFYRNVSVKAQWTRVEARDSAAFVMPGTTDDHINVLSAGVDFVF